MMGLISDKNGIWMIISESHFLLQHNVSCGRSHNLQSYEWLHSDTTFFLNNILKVSLVGEGTIRFCQIKTNITIRPSGVSTMKLEKNFSEEIPRKSKLWNIFSEIFAKWLQVSIFNQCSSLPSATCVHYLWKALKDQHNPPSYMAGIQTLLFRNLILMKYAEAQIVKTF